MAALAALLVFANALAIDLIVEFRLEANGVQAEACGMRIQVRAAEMVRVGEQQIVHRPELSLRSGGFRGFRGHQGMRVSVLDREMTKHKGHFRVQSPQLPDRGLDADAGWALEIAVLKNDHPGVGGPGEVVGGRHRHGQGSGSMDLIHLSFSRSGGATQGARRSNRWVSPRHACKWRRLE